MEYLLEAKDIIKVYPGVRALNKVNFSVKYGEVHALLGENGAGKSTLIKILSGSEQKDAGEIYLEGKKLDHFSPHQAIDLGISVIYQEFNLLPHMTVEENISLGKEKTKGFLLDGKAMLERARSIIADFQLDIDPKAKISELSTAHQQMVEIIKALLYNAKLVVMDEPSAVLSNKELEKLFNLIRELRANGKSIIYISHRLEEVFEISDRVTVLRDGNHIITREVEGITRQELIKNMVGYDIHDNFPQTSAREEDVVMSVSGLYNSKVKDVNFKLYKGEVLGIGGLVGSGRTEIARSLFGADPYVGNIEINGKPVHIQNPQDAIRYGIGLIPEERKTQGVLQEMSVETNLTLASLKKLSRFAFVVKKAERKLVGAYIEKLAIKTPSFQQLVKNLSGGNQQKVVITKWLATDCDILIFDEPTRGIDVGAKQEIYKLMGSLTKAGKSIIMISSELPELIGMSDRVIVMFEGRQMATLDKDENISQEKIMALASGEGG